MKQILIIDSDVELLHSLGQVLSEAGYGVLIQDTAQGGLKYADQADLVIVAVELPDQNGFAVCSSLKRNPQTADKPVFITSSATTTTAFEKHLNLTNHADGYFLKPIDIPTLLQQTAEIFEEQDAYAAYMEQVAQDGYVDADTDVASDEEVKALALDDMSLFGDITDDSFDDSFDDVSDIPEGVLEPEEKAPEAPKPAVKPPLPFSGSPSGGVRVPPIGAHTAPPQGVGPKQPPRLPTANAGAPNCPPPRPGENPSEREAALVKELAQRDTDIRSLQTRNSELETQVQQLQMQLESCQKQIEGLLRTNAEHQENAAMAQNMAAEKNKRIESLAHQLLELLQS